MSASRVSMFHSDICSMFFLVLRGQIGHFITSCNDMASEFEVRQTGFGARLELKKWRRNIWINEVAIEKSMEIIENH